LSFTSSPQIFFLKISFWVKGAREALKSIRKKKDRRGGNFSANTTFPSLGHPRTGCSLTYLLDMCVVALALKALCQEKQLFSVLKGHTGERQPSAGPRRERNEEAQTLKTQPGLVSNLMS
jgi:hypothetical protein